ncbi:MAG: hypothetical protein HZA29_04065 [Candidatus Omnitrophica bacterium]|nr:hypothetical protein [Candidatus Omnitrophota bacterium]
MSIINEALKKTQTLRQTTSPAADNRTSQPPKTWAEPESVLSVAHSISLPTQPLSAPARPKQKKWHIIVLLEILFLLFIVGVLFILQPKFASRSLLPKATGPRQGRDYRPRINFSAETGKNALPQQPSAAVATAPAAIPAAPPPPAAPRRQKRGLTVDGVMMNNGKIMALINGEIYETGDYIDGKKITNITLNEVVLMDKDEVTVLGVRRAGP